MNYGFGYDEVKFGTLLNDQAVEYEFQVSRSQGGYRMMPTVKNIFDRYPGVKIKLMGIEDLKNKLVTEDGNTRPMTKDDVKNVAKLADRVKGFLTKEERKERINQLDTKGLFNDE